VSPASHGCSISTFEEKMRLMQTLDDAWNTQERQVFDKRHFVSYSGKKNFTMVR